MVKIVTNRNCVYQIAYHVIWCPKYRQHILVNDVAKWVDKELRKICQDRKWQIISCEIQPDRVHLFVSISPSVSIANAVKIFKGTTARKAFLEFPNLKQKLYNGHLWSPSYYVGTAGNISADTIQKYIERSAHVNKRR